MQEDLHQFIKDFGTKIVFTLADGTVIDKDSEGNDLKGIYDSVYVSSEMGYMTVSHSNPQLSCVKSDVVSIVRGCSVLIEGEGSFGVVSNLPDGTGMATIKLSNAK